MVPIRRILGRVTPSRRNVISSNVASLKRGARMKSLLLAALVLTASLAVTQSQSEKPAGKPVKESPVIVESAPPPSTLTEMVAQADAVVIARATGRTRLKARQRADSALLSTHSLNVEEVIKFHPAVPIAGEVIDLDLLGGTREYDSYILSESVEDWDRVVANHRYLVFVRYLSNEFGERLVPVWAAAGIFDITGNTAKSLDKRFRRYNDKASPQFLDDTKAVARGAKRP